LFFTGGSLGSFTVSAVGVFGGSTPLAAVLAAFFWATGFFALSDLLLGFIV
jgi:hypothetical protein